MCWSHFVSLHRIFAASVDSAILSKQGALLPMYSPHCYVLTSSFPSGCHFLNNLSETQFASCALRLISSPDVSLPLMVLLLSQSPILETAVSPLFLPSSLKSVRLCIMPLLSLSIIIVIPPSC